MEIKNNMEWYFLLKTLHIISSTILFGTGIGIAFFMFRSWCSNDIQQKLFAANNTVTADLFFTLPAVVVQPLSGIALILITGIDWTAYWLVITYIIYAIAGLCWIPVVWIQVQLKRLCQEAVKTGEPLPERYHQLFKLWFALGWPAFFGLVFVFYLMVAKPL